MLDHEQGKTATKAVCGWLPYEEGLSAMSKWGTLAMADMPSKAPKCTSLHAYAIV